MHRKNLYPLIITIFFIAIFLYSCDLYKKERGVLEQAELLLDTHPESALQLLDSIPYPKSIDEDFFNHYYLVRIQARHKCYKDISKDTLIFGIKDYYLDKKNMDYAALSAFYCGIIFEDNYQLDRAVLSFIEAEKYAENTQNTYLKGLIQFYIGDMYFKKISPDEAIFRLKKAAINFSQQSKYEAEVMTYNKLGISYLVKGETDSAFYFYTKSIELTKNHNNTSLLSTTYHLMGVTYDQMGELEKALDIYREAIPLCGTNEDKVICYAGIASIFSEDANRDSTMHYLNMVAEIDPERKDSITQRNMTRILYRLEENTENYKKALDYHKEYTQLIVDLFGTMSSQTMYEIERKYNYEQVKSENNQLEIQKQRLVIVSLLILLASCSILAFFYWRHTKDKEAVFTAEQKSLQMKVLADSYDKKNHSMRNIVLEHFNILKKTALIEAYLREEDKVHGQKMLRKFHETVYGQDTFDWDKMYEAINHLCNGVVGKIRHKYGLVMDDSEFKITCLTYADLNNTEISIIMGLKLNTVQSKKYNIRKKLGITGYGNINDFMKDRIYLNDDIVPPLLFKQGDEEEVICPKIENEENEIEDNKGENEVDKPENESDNESEKKLEKELEEKTS